MSTVPAVLPNPRAGSRTEPVWSNKVRHNKPVSTGIPWLIAQGRSLAVPHLGGVALRHASFGSDAAAARFGAILLELGIAKPGDWKTSEPGTFLERTLNRFVRAHGASQIDGAFELSLTLSTSPHEWCQQEDETDGSEMFLYFECYHCGFVNLGPAIAFLERIHPRLPVTFARLFLDSIGRCFRVYDERDADEHISILEENVDPEESREGGAALPDRNNIVPLCMKRKRLRRRSLRNMLSRLKPRSRAARLLGAVVKLARIAETVKLPEIPESVHQMFGSMNPPVPVLLAIYQTGDAIEAAFDDERQYMLQETPEPQPLIPFNGTDLKSTRQAFECLGHILDMLAAGRRVLDLVPGWEPEPIREKET